MVLLLAIKAEDQVPLQEKVTRLAPGLDIDILGSVRSGLAWIAQQSGAVFQGVVRTGLALFLSIVALFYWFKDSQKIRSIIFSIIPLGKEDMQDIAKNIALSARSLIRGTLFVALLQGISAGIGFTIFGVPNAILWASVTIVCAIVPTFGTSLIFIPVVAYLYLTGHGGAALGTAIWGLTAVGLLDNVLGPRLMSQGSNLHPFFTLLAVLGGVELFGAIGVFAGPLLVSLLFAVSQAYLSRMETRQLA